MTIWFRMMFCLASAAALSGQVKFPAYKRQVLPNGVVVDLVPKPGIPLVNFHIRIKGGAGVRAGRTSGTGGSDRATSTARHGEAHGRTILQRVGFVGRNVLRRQRRTEHLH